MAEKDTARRPPGGGGETLAGQPRSLVHQHSTTIVGRQVYAQGRVVGRLTPDGWLVKTGLDPRKHKVRTPPGWATDAAHLLIPDLRGVRLHLVDGATLEAPVEAWRRYGVPLSRGFGAQVLLVDEYWRVWRPGEMQQLELFEVAL